MGVIGKRVQRTASRSWPARRAVTERGCRETGAVVEVACADCLAHPVADGHRLRELDRTRQ